MKVLKHTSVRSAAPKRSAIFLICAASLALSVAACGQPLLKDPDAATQAAFDQAVEQTKFDTLIEEITNENFRQNPEYATYFGLPEDLMGGPYNNRLTERGPEAVLKDLGKIRADLEKLNAVRVEALSEQQKLTLMVVKRQLELDLRIFETAPFLFGGLYPVSQLSGLQIELPNLMQAQQPLATDADVVNYIARLNAFGPAFDQTIDEITAEQALGVVPPKFVINKTLAVIDAFTGKKPTENILYATLADKMAAANLADREARLAETASAIETVVYPAYERLKAKLTEQLAVARDQQGLGDLPNGQEAYQLMIEANADSSMTAQEIHAFGLSEVSRIQSEMDAILTSQGYTEGSVGERVAKISTEPRFVYLDTDEGKAQLIADLNAQMAEIAPLLPQYFGTIPPQPVEIRRVPLFSEASAPGGYYDLPSLNGTRPGIYWINLKTTSTWPKWTLKTLTYHEASPGHHHQIALSLAVPDVPLIRKLTGTTTAFAEGWALYVEKVAAKDMGLYTNDPFGDVGRLQAELFRAVRLVVDTGLHSKGWTREQAIEFMVSSGAADPIEAEREIERYVAWPGQALGYKVGMAEFERMRREAEAALGDKFNLAKFHDALLLDGGLPLPILETRVKQWVEATKAG